MKSPIVWLISIAALLAPAAGVCADYAVHAGKECKVVFVSRAANEKFEGKTDRLEGRLSVDPAALGDSATFHFEVDMASLDTGIKMRNQHMRENHLETAKFPTMEFVPKRAVGLPAPLPAGMQAQAGFQLIGDMTLHGVTKEATWNVVATFGNELVGGRATTTTDFATFGLTKPSLARLMSVEDKIELEIEFRCKRTVVTPAG